MAEQLPWLWRDSKRVTHFISEAVDTPNFVTRLEYKTRCGKTVSVDAVNPQSKVFRMTPSCLRCTVAPVLP